MSRWRGWGQNGVARCEGAGGVRNGECPGGGKDTGARLGFRAPSAAPLSGGGSCGGINEPSSLPHAPPPARQVEHSSRPLLKYVCSKLINAARYDQLYLGRSYSSERLAQVSVLIGQQSGLVGGSASRRGGDCTAACTARGASTERGFGV